MEHVAEVAGLVAEPRQHRLAVDAQKCGRTPAHFAHGRHAPSRTATLG